MTATPSLVIHGAHGSDVWVEVDGDLVCLTRNDLIRLWRWIDTDGVGTIAGVTFDESDLIALENASEDSQLDDCRTCSGPGLINHEGHAYCPGCMAGYGAREEGL